MLNYFNPNNTLVIINRLQKFIFALFIIVSISPSILTMTGRPQAIYSNNLDGIAFLNKGSFFRGTKQTEAILII